MIVSANERYRVAGDFAQFLYWLYTLRGAATAAGVMSAAAVFSMLLPAMRQKAGGWLTVTLRAECLEEIGREVPLTDD